MPNSTKKVTLSKKKQMLEALKKNLGMVTPSCKMVGISNMCFYRWLKDPKFKEEYDQIDDYVLEFMESALFKKVEQGDTRAITFWLKHNKRARSKYSTESHIIADVNQAPTAINLIIPKEAEITKDKPHEPELKPEPESPGLVDNGDGTFTNPEKPEEVYM